jgi:hypothetical protein
MKPYPETMYVQFLQQHDPDGTMNVVGVVMDKRTHVLTNSPLPATKQWRPLEIVYAVSDPCINTQAAAWNLWDTVIWKQMAGEPRSLAYVEFLNRQIRSETDERANDEKRAPLSPLSPTFEHDASSTAEGATPGNAARGLTSPPWSPGMPREEHAAGGPSGARREGPLRLVVLD